MCAVDILKNFLEIVDVMISPVALEFDGRQQEFGLAWLVRREK